MEMNQKKPNVEPENELPKTLPLDIEISRENQSASKNEEPVHRVELKKTTWDRIVEALDVLSSIAMVVLTVFLAIFAYNQWNAAEKQADAARKQVEAATEQIKVAKAQNELVRKQADAANKQVEAATEQIKVAKAQNELAERTNAEAKISNLKMTRIVGAYYVGGSDDIKDNIDLVFRNKSARPTAILSIYLRKKEGGVIRAVGEPDGIKLPLNVGAWRTEKISFVLKKAEIVELEDILVTDMDDNQIITKQDWHQFLKPQDLSIKIHMDNATLIREYQNVTLTVSKNQTVPVFGGKLSISVQNITRGDNSSSLVVYGAVSAPGEKSKEFSFVETGTCLSYGGFAIRVTSISTDSADFSVSDEKLCK